MDRPGVFDVFGLTDPGAEHSVNQDQFLVTQLNTSLLISQASLQLDDHTRLLGDSRGRMLLVADGLGDHASVRRASTIAVNFAMDYVLNTMPWYFRLDPQDEDDLAGELRSALRRCQNAIVQLSEGHPRRAGIGTTLTMAYTLWPRLYVVHAGNSRCYLLRGTVLEQITSDHTAPRTEGAAAAPREAPGPRMSTVLWNATGAGTDDLVADVYKARLRVGDALLLCTDGLTRHLDDEALLDVLQASSTAEDACRSLVAAANEDGGSDNITAVVAYIHSCDDVASGGAELSGITSSADAGTRPHSRSVEVRTRSRRRGGEVPASAGAG